MFSLIGSAGTGKTLLAIAVGLFKTLKEINYDKLLVAPSLLFLWVKILGALPGTLEEKMEPWVQPLYDAIEFLKILDRRSRTPMFPQHKCLDELNCIKIEPLTYIRGRSIPNQFIIIDEAQKS